jgi:hypothetical protein
MGSSQRGEAIEQLARPRRPPAAHLTNAVRRHGMPVVGPHPQRMFRGEFVSPADAQVPVERRGRPGTERHGPRASALPSWRTSLGSRPPALQSTPGRPQRCPPDNRSPGHKGYGGPPPYGWVRSGPRLIGSPVGSLNPANRWDAGPTLVRHRVGGDRVSKLAPSKGTAPTVRTCLSAAAVRASKSSGRPCPLSSGRRRGTASWLGASSGVIWHEGRSGAQFADRAGPRPCALTWYGAGEENRTPVLSLGS